MEWLPDHERFVNLTPSFLSLILRLIVFRQLSCYSFFCASFILVHFLFFYRFVELLFFLSVGLCLSVGRSVSLYLSVDLSVDLSALSCLIVSLFVCQTIVCLSARLL